MRRYLRASQDNAGCRGICLRYTVDEVSTLVIERRISLSFIIRAGFVSSTYTGIFNYKFHSSRSIMHPLARERRYARQDGTMQPCFPLGQMFKLVSGDLH